VKISRNNLKTEESNILCSHCCNTECPLGIPAVTK